ncbi:(Fe-S)-binding protein [Methylobacter sp. S3L5C]|uniref:(Fe-S)-binding protein n=1 Tax=Methylobacter sp. S3L5C TaxID=2839024 RepID=UPI001FAC1A89|nr:(Fe-S)-binding protein [Methylobacter sp. S3L5C]UOA07839.1 (Fe-S)-binding protein [Methylobacter sp. S3L5C]
MFEFIDDYSSDNVIYPQDGLYIPDATECMRCGLCISLCPTYKLFRIEAETPRSRLRTIDKIINENTAVSDKELKHLNNCTQCRACETICPGKMAYGHLFDLAREQRCQTNALDRRGNFLTTIGFKLIEHKALLTAATVIIRLYQKTGLQFLLRKTALLRLFKLDKAELLMPEADISNLARRYPTDKQHRGNVALFTGCISDHFDRKTLLAAVKLLNVIGFDVLVPKAQTCCGAIHQHQGKTDIADKMATLNIDVFNSLDIEAIIFTASGCGLMLNEYEQKAGDAPKNFSNNLFDITEFLNRHWPDDIKLKEPHANARKVAVHEPCSQRNVPKPELGNKDAWSRHQHVYALLEKIPEITVISLPENQICCGAGGVHMLTHPEIAEPLRNIKLAHFEQTKADFLVSTNIGCALHLTTGLPRNKVIHPVVLLAELLP